MSKTIEYNVGNEKHYMIGSTDYTETQYKELQAKYEKKGYEERMVGYYDKWYRYYTFDNGKSYDKGCMRAVETHKCVPDCTIIECN